MKKIIFTCLFALLTINLFANANSVEMADTLRSNGKIFVVVAIIVLILVGLLVYLFSLDKRLKMLEKKLDSKN